MSLRYAKRLCASVVAIVSIVLLVIVALGGCSARHGERVFVLAMEGATFDLLTPWAKEGRLPNLARLMDGGTATLLSSTIPPSTAVAWATAVTGVNPGKHGIFGSNRQTEPGAQTMRPNTSLDRKADAVWNLLNAAGKKAVVINVPLTTPAEPIDGVMVGGPPYVVDGGSLFHPPEIAQIVDGYQPRRQVEAPRDGEEEAYVRDLERVARRRLKLVMDLSESEEWDLFWAVFDMTDPIQMHFWKHIDEFHPDHDKESSGRLGESVYRAYSLMDSVLGEIEAGLPPGTTLIVMSAYGYGPVYQKVHGRSVIEEFKRRGETMENFGGFDILPVDPLEAKLRVVEEKGRQGEYTKQARNTFIHYLHERLSLLRDRNRNCKPISEAYLGAQIYDGPYADSAPDVIGLEEEPYLFSNTELPEDLGIFAQDSDPAFPSGYHRRRGVLIMRGTGIERGRYDVRGKASDMGARLEDLVPTILARLGVEAPADLDGRDLLDG